MKKGPEDRPSKSEVFILGAVWACFWFIVGYVIVMAR